MSDTTTTPTDFSSFSEAMNADDATFAAAFNLPAPSGEPAAPETVWADPSVTDIIAQVTSERPRDEQGRFAAKDTPAPDAPAAEAPADPAEPPVEAEASPDAEAPAEDTPAEEPPAETRALATKFAIVEGDATTDPGALADTVIEYKADGKVYRETLDKVVRLAQSGRYNTKLHEELDSLRPLEAKVDELEAQRADDLRFYRQEVQKLIADDTYLMQRRQDLAQRLTPEAEADRLRRELAQERQSREMMQLQGKMEHFVEHSIQPKMLDILSQYPSVTEDELMGRFNRTVLPMQRHGVVPPHLWPRVEALLEGEIGSWAAHLHDSRTAERATAEAQTKAQVRKAQEKAQKAKQVLARTVTSPASARSAPEATRSKPIVTADDALNDIIGGVARSLLSS